MTSLTLSNDSIIVDDKIRDEALELVDSAEDDRISRLVVHIGRDEFEVPEALSSLLVHVIERAALGGTMHIRSMPEELTTTVAAELLGVSRPTLMKMIQAKEINSRAVGSHHRLRSQDVIAARDARNAARRDALKRLRSELPD